MLKSNKAMRAAIVLSAIFVALILSGIFTLGSVGNNPSSAWSSRPAVDNGDTYFPDSVVLSVSTIAADGSSISTDDGEGGKEVHIWINVGRIYKTRGEKAVIEVQWKSTSDFSDGGLAANKDVIEIEKGVDVSKGQYQFAWHDTKISRYYSYCRVSTSDAIEINEIVFTNKNGDLLNASVIGANEWKSLSGGVYSEYVTAENFSKDNTANGLLDEQSKFKEYSPMSKKYNFTSEEASAVNSSLSIFAGDGTYADNKSGPLGVELISIGLAAFGINTLGVRIVPYIFFLFTIGLMFALGRRIFKDSDAGLIMAGFYVLFGLGLSVGGIGSVTSIGVFFALLSVFFMYAFFAGTDKYLFGKDNRIYGGKFDLFVPVVISAMSFAFAFSVKISMIFVLPALIVLLVLGVMNAVRVHRSNAASVKFEDEKIRNDSQFKINAIGSSVVFGISYATLTFLFALLFYSVIGTNYIKFYSTDSLLPAIAANMKGGLFGTSGERGAVLKWLIGGGSTAILSSGERSVNMGMNAVVQVIALISILATSIIICLGAFSKKASADMKVSAKKYASIFIVLCAGWIFNWAMFALVKGAIVSDYLLASAFACGFIALEYNLLKTGCELGGTAEKTLNVANIVLWISLAISILLFGLGYVMFAGIAVNPIATKILFGWWLF